MYNNNNNVQWVNARGDNDMKLWTINERYTFAEHNAKMEKCKDTGIV